MSAAPKQKPKMNLVSLWGVLGLSLWLGSSAALSGCSTLDRQKSKKGEAKNGGSTATAKNAPAKRSLSPEELATLVEKANQTLSFEGERSDLKPASKSELAELAAKLKEASVKGLIVEGYADDRDSVSYNQTLSTRRAESVRKFLKSVGLQDTSIDTVGRGSNDLVEEDSPLAAHRNKRAIIFLKVRDLATEKTLSEPVTAIPLAPAGAPLQSQDNSSAGPQILSTPSETAIPSP